MKWPIVYLAGPVAGLHYDDADDWRQKAIGLLAVHGIEGRSPLRGKEPLRHVQKLDGNGYEWVSPLASQKGIVTRDRNDVMTCDAVLMNLAEASRVSIGSMVEYGWADAYRKPLVLIENLSPDNPHDHLFVKELSGYIVQELEDAVMILASLLGSR